MSFNLPDGRWPSVAHDGVVWPAKLAAMPGIKAAMNSLRWGVLSNGKTKMRNFSGVRWLAANVVAQKEPLSVRLWTELQPVYGRACPFSLAA